ncbi:Autophagy-related protein 2 [Bienertia sinuspersici]
MADIAMLVAEEYERRVRLDRKMGYEEAKTTSLLAPIQWLKEHNLLHEIHIQIKIIEPKVKWVLLLLMGCFLLN